VPSGWSVLTIVQLLTDEGIYGLGEAGLHNVNRGTAVIAAELVEKYALGQDPRHVERLWDGMYRGSFWARNGGAAIMAAMSAIEEACWDIAGKALGVPAYMLLGGKVRDRIRLYANGWYKRNATPTEFARQAERVLADGFTALKFDPFRYSSDDQGEIPFKSWDRHDIDVAVARVAAVREVVGPEVDILLEAHGWFDVNTAIEVGKRMEQFNLLAYEEPMEPTNAQAMAQVAAGVRIPIASGERLYTRFGFLPFLQAGALHVLQPDIGNTGGMLETRKIAALADTFHLPIAPHNCWGPVATAAAVNVDASTTNFLIQEWFAYESEEHYAVVDRPYEREAKGGYLEIPNDRPGLGVLLNEQVVKDSLFQEVKG